MKAPCVAHRYTGQGGQSKKGDQVASDSILTSFKGGRNQAKTAQN